MNFKNILISTLALISYTTYMNAQNINQKETTTQEKITQKNIRQELNINDQNKYKRFEPQNTLEIPQFKDSTNLTEILLDEDIKGRYKFKKNTAKMYSNNKGTVYVEFTHGKNAKGKRDEPIENLTILKIQKTETTKKYPTLFLEQKIEFENVKNSKYEKGKIINTTPIKNNIQEKNIAIYNEEKKLEEIIQTKNIYKN
ncbi:MAG: hypothetical protein ACOC1K_01985 [Nanoarchaeota archaeon]